MYKPGAYRNFSERLGSLIFEGAYTRNVFEHSQCYQQQILCSENLYRFSVVTLLIFKMFRMPDLGLYTGIYSKAFLPANFILPCCGNYYSCCTLKEKDSTTENHGRFPLCLSKGLGNSTCRENNGQRFFRNKNSPRAKLGFLVITSPHGAYTRGLYPGKTRIMDLKIT